MTAKPFKLYLPVELEKKIKTHIGGRSKVIQMAIKKWLECPNVKSSEKQYSDTILVSISLQDDLIDELHAAKIKHGVDISKIIFKALESFFEERR